MAIRLSRHGKKQPKYCIANPQIERYKQQRPITKTMKENIREVKIKIIYTFYDIEKLAMNKDTAECTVTL